MDMDLVESSEGAGDLASAVLTVTSGEKDRNNDQKPPFLLQKARSKTSLRIRYEAETEVIKRKLGSLEGVRSQLGLSQRKICQLLLVDPSAWSRWVRADEDAPPHIYRMLQWYLALEEKYPALDVNFWLNTVVRAQEPLHAEIRDARLSQIPGKVEMLTAQLSALQMAYEKQQRLLGKVLFLGAAAAFLAIGLLGWRLLSLFSS